MKSRAGQEAVERERKEKGERMECSGCDKFFGEKLLNPTPNGMKCNKCIDEEDLDENKENPLTPKVGYFSSEDDDCSE